MARPDSLATTDAPEAPPTKRFKMRLKQSEYMVEIAGNSGRFPAGAVLLADEATAIRWYERDIAEPAPADAETFGEVARRNKKAEFYSRAEVAETVFDASVTRASSERQREPSLMPSPMPTPRTRREREEALAGAAVINAPDGDE